MSNEKRQAAGQPTGGEFAPHTRKEGDVGLTGQHQAPEVFTATTNKPASGRWSILDTVAGEAEQFDQFKRVKYHVGGQPHLRARTRVAAHLAGSAARTQAEEIAAAGGKMTLLLLSDSGSVEAQEGTGIDTGNGLAILRKGSGSTGWLLESLNIIGVQKGYRGEAKLAEEFSDLMNQVPPTEEATFDDLPVAEDGQEPPEGIAAVYLVDGPRFSHTDPESPGCLFMATDIDGDIVNGYLWTPGDSPLFSEHGSMLTSQIKLAGGRVTGYVPGSVTFTEALDERIGDTRQEAYARVLP